MNKDGYGMYVRVWGWWVSLDQYRALRRADRRWATVETAMWAVAILVSVAAVITIVLPGIIYWWRG